MHKELKELKVKLRSRYKDGDGNKPSVQRELAIIERRAWVLEKLEYQERGDRVPLREKWFESIGANAQITAMVRSNLLAAGEWVSPLWDMVHESKIPLRPAYKLSLKAKKISQSKSIELSDALNEVIADYYCEDTYEAKGPKGIPVRRRRPQIKEVPIEVVDPKEWDPDVDDSKKFRALLHTLTKTFVDNRLSVLEDSVRKDLIRDFEFEIRVIYEDLLKKINTHRRDLGMSLDIITFGTARQACEVLGVVVPKKGWRVDAIAARRAHRKLAAQYHPDRNGGSDRLVAQYQAVNEAWEVIQNYNEQLEE